MNAIGHKVLTDRTAAAKIPPHMRHKAGEVRPQDGTKQSTRLASFQARVAAGHSAAAVAETAAATAKKLSESVGLLKEASTPAEAKEWLRRAASVVSDRADSIENVDEKKGFQQLAALINSCRPAPGGDEAQEAEAINHNLDMLRTKLELEVRKGEDSDHLKQVKNFLLGELGNML